MSLKRRESSVCRYCAFSSMHVQKAWDDIMNASANLDDTVLAETP
jgi:hypothetical protein